MTIGGSISPDAVQARMTVRRRFSACPHGSYSYLSTSLRMHRVGAGHVKIHGHLVHVDHHRIFKFVSYLYLSTSLLMHRVGAGHVKIHA